jgi:hypothetical protein
MPSLAEKLDDLKPKAHDDYSRSVLDGATFALAHNANPLRLNFFSTAMRMLFEHMMDSLAPRDKVVRCSWFKAETEDGRPTRAQRALYAIQGGFTSRFVNEQLGVDPAPLAKALRSAIDELSKQIHGRENTISADLAEQDALAGGTLDAMTAFLDAARETRDEVLRPVQEALDDAAIDAMMFETIQDMDELSSHYSLEEVYVDRTVVHEIGPDAIVYRSTGSVSVTLQWGSNSDLRRGEGAELDQSFPFQCDMTLPLDHPWDLDMAETAAGVDTSEWWDAREPEQ